MQDRLVALVTGANQGIGLQIEKDLVAHGFTVLVGSRNLERGKAYRRPPRAYFQKGTLSAAPDLV